MTEMTTRTLLRVGDLAKHADWSAFYESHLQRDFPVLARAAVTEAPTSAPTTHVLDALATGRTMALGHWAHTAHGGGPTAIGPLDIVCRNPKDGIANRVRKMIAAHAALLSLSGVVVVDVRDLLGLVVLDSISPNQISQALENAQGLHKRIFDGIVKLVRARAAQAAFAPQAPQTVLSLTEGVWSIVRTAISPDPSPLNLQQGRVVCLTNLSAQEQLVSADWRALLGTRHAVRDLFTGTRFNVHGPSLALQPYQVMWVTV